MRFRLLQQERNLDFLVANNGFQFSNTFFPYTSGQIGPYYVNSESVMKNAGHYKQACDDLSFLVSIVTKNYSRDIDIIAGGEKRDWVFSNVVAEKVVKAPVMIYKDGSYIGADMNGNHVALVCDLNNEGSSPRDSWIPTIKKAGGSISHIFFYVDRLEDGTNVMKQLGLESNAVVPLDEHAWDYLQRKNIVNEIIYKNLRERMEDKDAWARNMLQSSAGIKELAKLYGDPTKRKKVAKIFYEGYPDLQEQILDGIHASSDGNILHRNHVRFGLEAFKEKK